MEKRSYAFHASSKDLKLIFLFVFCSFNTSLQCQERVINHYSTKPPSSPSSSSTTPEFKSRLQSVMLSIVFGIITGLICAILFACLVKCFIGYLNKTPILRGPVIFSPKIAPKTLQSALANENELLGSSPSGKYYRTVLDNGLTVAVKRLEPIENGSPETRSKSVKRHIQQELEMAASLRHRNLMSLRAYVRESDRFFLVYDHVSTGSLDDAMNRVRENQLQLNWEVRLRIAVGITKALQYLHFTCNPRILHCNLKPTNVMLDAEFEPRLTDLRLAKLMPGLDGASLGYVAPECLQNCRYTEKSDSFSFGVILGVLLTGRDPMDPFFDGAATGGSLGRWLRHLQQEGEAREALDRSILGEEVEEDEMLMAVRIAVACLSDLPADRPSSDELVSMLTQLHSF
ncbi:inactive leucine-rich repeat receptor-like protein kinase CORYNE [Cornus florida]|uniref:inactive leucine-rich repeat receptor-like protein kinase CORYNE n=1 Tax=Cornus florida TaxID=4283 RepID=UPI00289BA069|nr:inactive leucine-rich repeat receptor-like protein kinase CORYNE [Cornus florida]XP_059656534.1 inactive leucine-rich repeat receptor-like protein kinase CORYNE [Cornus florida]